MPMSKIGSLFKDASKFGFSPVSWLASVAKNIFGANIKLPSIVEAATSYVNAKTGAGLTNAQIEQNAWNAGEAEKQRAWTEQMDNTKYQRQTQDMAAAGLNPAMMYGQGYSASTPSGSAASGSSEALSGGFVDDLLNVLFAKQRLANLRAEQKNVEADTELKGAEKLGVEAGAEKAGAETSLIKEQLKWYPQLQEAGLKKIDAEVSKLYSDCDVNDAEILNLDADTALKESQTAINEIRKEWEARLSSAKELSDKAAAAAAFARAAYDRYFIKFAKEHGGQLPGYNTWSGIAASLAGVLEDLGWSSEEATTQVSDIVGSNMFIDFFKKYIIENIRKGIDKGFELVANAPD